MDVSRVGGKLAASNDAEGMFHGAELRDGSMGIFFCMMWRFHIRNIFIENLYV
jgi:hypothetical protein